MLFTSAFFATFLVLAAGRPQAPPPGQQAPGGPAPSGQGPSHGNSPPATIVKNEFVDNGAGSYNWNFETSDGTKADQTGHTVNPMDGEIVQGSYTYNSPDGQVIHLTYIADKNGFQPMGAHLPTPPADPNHAAAGAPGGPGGAPGGPGGAPGGPGGAPAGGPHQS